jgi:hypothetical protein
MGRGTQQVYTLWVPYGDVALEMGGLMILEDSHKKSDLLRNYLQRDVDSYCLNRSGAEEARTKEQSLWNGWLGKNPVAIRQKLGGRWLTAEFKVGDVVTFGMKVVHASPTTRVTGSDFRPIHVTNLLPRRLMIGGLVQVRRVTQGLESAAGFVENISQKIARRAPTEQANPHAVCLR